MHRFPLLACVLAAMMAAGCSGSGTAQAPKAAAATIEHPRTESELTTVRLTPEAIKRLGIATVTAKTETAPATRVLGGEVVVPEGRSIVVTAPVAGTLTAAGDARAGARLRRGDPIVRLMPLVPAERDQRIEAQRAVSAAEADEQASRQRLQRLEQLLKDGAASQRAVEEAQAQQKVAAAALTAARERVSAITKNPVGLQGEIVLSAPFDGVVQRISAATGQTVAASAPLFEIAQVDALWVRVPAYAGQVDSFDLRQPVIVTRLSGNEAPRPSTSSGRPEALEGRQARRVVAPPLSADPSAASVDLFFELTRSGVSLTPGERVTVELPLKTTERALVIPDGAVLYDIHGDTWTYEDLGNGAYARRRVDIARHAGSFAVVSRGLSEGTKVVTTGAAELFGTEFGAGH